MNATENRSVARGKVFAVAPMMERNDNSKKQWFRKRRVRHMCSERRHIA